VPLEVRQIGIRMQVGDAAPNGAGDGEDKSSVLDLLADGDDDDRAQLIEECVAAVLAELARRGER
jgi:hypothetical protein